MHLGSTKVCFKCKKEKSVEDFPIRKSTLTQGPHSYCHVCYRKIQNSNRRRNYNPTSQNNTGLKFRYGITLDEKIFVFDIQNRKCALCQRLVPLLKLNVDHDNSHHQEKQRGCRECVRGLLCTECNLHFLPVAENFPHLQVPIVLKYLATRPFKTEAEDHAIAV